MGRKYTNLHSGAPQSLKPCLIREGTPGSGQGLQWVPSSIVKNPVTSGNIVQEKRL
jgi:hypothetical protein